jgi:hypothetical protein
MEQPISDQEAANINDRMAEQIERRRRDRPERRQRSERINLERRKICSYCFQPGDHQTPAQCLRALERS